MAWAQALAAAARVAKKDAKTAANVILLDELKHRRKVLRRLGCALSPHSFGALDLLSSFGGLPASS